MKQQTATFADLDLARLIERSEAVSSARFVEARARVSPESGAAWKQVAGAYAFYDGPGSPVTRTFGLEVYEPATEALLDELDASLRERGAKVNYEVSPLAGIECFRLLDGRGYRPQESARLPQVPIEARPPPATACAARQIHSGVNQRRSAAPADREDAEAVGAPARR